MGIVFIVRIKPWKEPWEKPNICCLCMTVLAYGIYYLGSEILGNHSFAIFFFVYGVCTAGIYNLTSILFEFFIADILILNKQLKSSPNILH